VPKEARKFVNPLTQSTTVQEATTPYTATSTETSTYTSTHDVLPSEGVVRRKRGAQAFEKTHERITLWLDKKLKEQFEQLADEEGISKTALLNEAVADVLKKHRK
jgi:Ribbon-helix-helix protein, copG family